MRSEKYRLGLLGAVLQCRRHHIIIGLVTRIHGCWLVVPCQEFCSPTEAVIRHVSCSINCPPYALFTTIHTPTAEKVFSSRLPECLRNGCLNNRIHCSCPPRMHNTTILTTAMPCPQSLSLLRNHMPRYYSIGIFIWLHVLFWE